MFQAKIVAPASGSGTIKKSSAELAPSGEFSEFHGHAIDKFVGWYCSQPGLAFNRTVVLRYRFFLEQNNLAPFTINVRLAAPAAQLPHQHGIDPGAIRRPLQNTELMAQREDLKLQGRTASENRQSRRE